MVRQHGSLEKDEETNQAAWEAARGALSGGTKVCICSSFAMLFCCFASEDIVGFFGVC